MTATLERIDKARRLLIEGRLLIEFVGPHKDAPHESLIVASCRGDSGEIYHLGFDPRSSEWRCSCPARTTCAHLKALMLVTVRRG